jgi:hypothetical protein
LRAGYDGMKRREAKIPADSKARLTDALRRLAQLYTAWGRPDEAEAWRNKLEETKAAPKKPAGG